jgi:hypothetical protein
MDLPASYEEDFYAWSQHQAAILRRLAAGARAGLPNDLDLENVAEEIEGVGRSELAAVRSQLSVMLVQRRCPHRRPGRCGCGWAR